MSNSQHPHNSESSPSYADSIEGQDADNTLAEKVQTLTWALVDEQLNEADRKQLESLLKTDPEARSTYVECVQMHVELQAFYAGELKSAEPSTPTSEVFPPLDLPSLFDGASTPSES